MPRPEDDFLSRYPRIPRFPLAGWAARLIPALRAANGTGSGPGEELFAALNKAALIFAQLGEPAAAERICDGELAWLAERACGRRPAAAAPLLRLAIDPWVNRGRLRAFGGAAGDARAHFAAVFSLASGAAAQLGPCRITPRTWAKITEIDPRMPDVARSAYVIDTLKACLRAGDFRGALEFIDNLPFAGGPRLGHLLDEAALIADSRLGRHERVLAATERPTATDPYHQAVLMLYRAAAGAPDAAGPVRALAIMVARGGLDPVPPASLLRFIDRHGDLLERLGAPDLALAVYGKGLELARRIDDQPFEWGFLKSLIRLGPAKGSRSAGWRAAHRELVAACDYAAVRKAEGRPPVSPAPADVYGRLLDAALSVTGEPAASGTGA